MNTNYSLMKLYDAHTHTKKIHIKTKVIKEKWCTNAMDIFYK